MADATIEPRLAELEIKASFADDLLERLNELVYRQQLQIEQLQRELAALRGQIADQATPAWRSLRDELPPHY
jgi:SlyX protein